MDRPSSKREEVLSRKFFGELEVLGNSSFRPDYVECLCSCGQVCNINFYNILEGKRVCCAWCKSPKTVKAREIKNFHRLTVVGHGQSSSDLKCECACGKIKDIPSLRLLNGDAKTCGCGYGRITQSDQCLQIKSFGRLQVIGKDEKAGRLKCICECGKVTTPTAHQLISGEVKSCGCLGGELAAERARNKGTMKVGQTYVSNSGDKVEVVEYIDCDNVFIRFPDGYVGKASAGNIRKGEIRNPYTKVVCGVGFMGEGNYDSKNKAYTHWNHMMQRCYTDNYGDTYTEAFVADTWHNYQNFAKWFETNWVGNSDVALDKDILIKGNKCYSPDTCCLVPENLNNFTCKADAIRGELPIGVRSRDYPEYTRYQAVMYKYGKLVHLGEFSSIKSAFQKYKEEKEKHAKILADKYFSQKLINLKTKNALYNYTVEVTD